MNNKIINIDKLTGLSYTLNDNKEFEYIKKLCSDIEKSSFYSVDNGLEYRIWIYESDIKNFRDIMIINSIPFESTIENVEGDKRYHIKRSDITIKLRDDKLNSLLND